MTTPTIITDLNNLLFIHHFVLSGSIGDRIAVELDATKLGNVFDTLFCSTIDFL